MRSGDAGDAKCALSTWGQNEEHSTGKSKPVERATRGISDHVPGPTRKSVLEELALVQDGEALIETMLGQVNIGSAVAAIRGTLDVHQVADIDKEAVCSCGVWAPAREHLADEIVNSLELPDALSVLRRGDPAVLAAVTAARGAHQSFGGTECASCPGKGWTVEHAAEETYLGLVDLIGDNVL